MRFTTALVAGAFATFASAQSATVSLNPVQASQAACIEDCPLGDTKCQSYCISVPSPNEKQVEETTKCAAECDQGSGSPSDTEKYAACQQKCIQDHYWNSEDGTPRETGSGSGSGSGSSEKSAAETTVETTLARATGSVTTTVTDATVTNTASESGSSDEADSTNSADDSESSGTATGTAAQSTETDSGASALVGGVSVFALFAAALAL